MENTPKNTRLGSYISCSTAGETYQSYIPTMLPPVPALNMDRLYKSLDQAMRALGGIDALAKLLPDIGLFLCKRLRNCPLFNDISPCQVINQK